MTAELPYELWQYIASFLDTKSLRTLLLVNQTLCSIAQGECYKTMAIGLMPYPLIVPRPNNILNAPRNIQWPIARRIKHLVFSYGDLTPPKKKRSKMRDVIMETMRGLRRLARVKRQHSDGNGTDIFNHFMDTVPALTSVSALTLDINLEQDDWRTQRLKILHASWPVFADNLRSLSITLGIEDIPPLLPKSKLNRLEILSISISWSLCSASHQALVMSNDLVPFIAAHCDTIRDFVLNLPTSLDHSTFLKSTPNLPFLRKFTLIQYYINLGQHDFDGHFEFLTAHRSHLQHLEVRMHPRSFSSPSFPSCAQWFSQPWQMIHFPNLHVLKFDIYDDLRWRDDINLASTPLFHQHMHQLVALEFRQWDVTYSNIAQFVTALRPSNLQNLSLSISTMSADLLHLLADELPKLHSLQLYSAERDIFVNGNNDQRLFKFCKDILNADFSEWKLHVLDLQFPFSFLNRKLFQAALLSALPRLQHLDGRWREEYRAGCYIWNEANWRK
ncbi:hypothetical protein BDN70DRAFT_916839 [Pholiota conissans]|uniref:F-box domain-containing protein n=1 Tax=Pholiota conissans TaxID=109636 RepID=A0A9P5ZEW3_9AGAR|nr:hypothetical protein BDN70DRAFT_916839 [Pholiota conissans]